jgi:diguanylate cyclase (GGDEF)-like protein
MNFSTKLSSSCHIKSVDYKAVNKIHGLQKMSYDNNISDDLIAELLTVVKERQLEPVYQPIVSFLDQRIIGYECLIRGPTTNRLQSPIEFFQTAQVAGCLLELEILALTAAIKQFQQQRLTGKLFINITLASLLHPDFQLRKILALLNQYGLSAENLVIELAQKYQHEQIEALREIVKSYRMSGCQIAIDDLGTGYSDLRLWSALRPHYVKIDNYFTQNIHAEVDKKEFVRSIRDIATRLNCQIIAEGIETKEDYQQMVKLGVRLGQGYYFAIPQATPPTELPNQLFIDFSHHIYNAHFSQISKTVVDLIIETPYVPPTATVESVAEIFHKRPDVHSIPVVSNQIAIGIVRRYDLMQVFLSRYGRDLHGRKSINGFMDKNPLTFDVNLSLEEASRQLTSEIKLVPENDFLICDQGIYRGLGRIMDLLKKITELQIRNARYANPLTLLPGNVPIYEHFEALISQRISFAVGYCDLDNFKPFNDVYGYDKGDLVIQTVAQILVAHTDPDKDFVGHVGGDDFIIIFQSFNWQERCEAILEEFGQTVLYFYNEKDRQEGGIRALDRFGNETFFAFLSLSIGVILSDLECCHSYHDIAALATEAKHEAKKTKGNNLFIDRRRQNSMFSDQ